MAAALASLPMPAELPAPNTGSPRVRAAMKVLGIHPKDIEVAERPAASKGGEDRLKNPDEIHFEAFERKRRVLLQQISNLADRTAPGGVPAAHEGGPAGSNASYLAAVLQKEQASLDALEKRAKFDVQKIVLDELEAKKQKAHGDKKAEESNERMKVLVKERAALLRAARKEAIKKQEKSVECRNRADKAIAKEAEEIMQKLDAQRVKAEGVFLKKDADWEVHKEKQAEERVRIKEHVANMIKTEWSSREETYEEICVRDDAIQKRIEAKTASRESHAEELRQKLLATVARCQGHKESKQSAREEVFAKHIVRMDEAEQVRFDLAKVKLKEYVTTNRKAKEAHAGRYERVVKEQGKGKNYETNSRLARSMSDMTDTVAARYQEQTLRQGQMNTIMHGLVAFNNERLFRAHEHGQEQALQKIDMIRTRVQATRELRKEAETRRFDAMKNCAVQKHHLAEKVEKVRDAPAHKMNRLLADLDLPPLPTGKKEGDEETKT